MGFWDTLIITLPKFSQLKKDWAYIKLGYAPKYSSKSGLKKARKIDNRLAKIRKKQAALDASIASTFESSPGKVDENIVIEQKTDNFIGEEYDNVPELISSIRKRAH